jgi:hypothetical protein
LYFENLGFNARTTLLRLAQEVGRVSPPEIESIQFRSSELHPEDEPYDLTRQVDKWLRREHKFIYYLETSANPDQISRAEIAFSEAKKHERDGRAFARFNQIGSNLYVGSSSSLGRRFREHLGYGARGTYALHLSQWARDIDLPLRFVAARYPASSVTTELLGLLEDQLWDALSPMFGRKGRR